MSLNKDCMLIAIINSLQFLTCAGEPQIKIKIVNNSLNSQRN